MKSPYVESRLVEYDVTAPMQVVQRCGLQLTKGFRGIHDDGYHEPNLVC